MNQKKRLAVIILIAVAVVAVAAGVLVKNAGEKNSASNTVSAESQSAASVTEEASASSSTEASETSSETSESSTTSKKAASATNKTTSKKTTTTKKATSSYKYLIKVNRTCNVVTVYSKDSNGEYTVPVKAMVCSVGTGGNTPTGTFTTSDKYTWRALYGGVYGQYATRITGHILFHSVPYYTQSKDDLEWEEYNKLGQAASAGCVRLTVADAKWIYDNCKSGTTVIIYDSSDPGPLGKPSAQKISADSPNRGWDPTDPDASNPW